MRWHVRRGMDVVLVAAVAAVATLSLMVVNGTSAAARPIRTQGFSNLALNLTPNYGPAGAANWPTQAQATGLEAGMTYRVTIFGPTPGAGASQVAGNVVANGQGNVIANLTLPGGPGGAYSVGLTRCPGGGPICSRAQIGAVVSAGFYAPAVKASYGCYPPDGGTGPSTPGLHIDVVGFPPGYTVKATLSGPAGVVSGPDDVFMQNGTGGFDGGSTSFPRWAPAGLAPGATYTVRVVGTEPPPPVINFRRAAVTINPNAVIGTLNPNIITILANPFNVSTTFVAVSCIPPTTTTSTTTTSTTTTSTTTSTTTTSTTTSTTSTTSTTTTTTSTTPPTTVPAPTTTQTVTTRAPSTTRVPRTTTTRTPTTRTTTTRPPTIPPTTAVATTTRTTTTTTTTAPPKTLVLDPPIGSPGSVTAAVGTGFAPGAALVLRWQPGLGVVRAVVGGDGMFRIQVLVLPNDRPGERVLVVDGDPSVTAPFRVVQGTAMPGGDGGVRFRH